MPSFSLPKMPQVPVFSSSKAVPLTLKSLEPVAKDVEEHFRLRGFDTTREETPTDGYMISVAKGTMFHAVLGMRMALNVTLEASGTETMVNAGVGLFGRQVVPVLVARFVFWPIWLTQAWGLVQQASLDDEAIDCAERSIRRRATTVTDVDGGEPAGESARHCTECGARLPRSARFCPACGGEQRQG